VSVFHCDLRDPECEQSDRAGIDGPLSLSIGKIVKVFRPDTTGKTKIIFKNSRFGRASPSPVALVNHWSPFGGIDAGLEEKEY
jgi:hypothetical protein